MLLGERRLHKTGIDMNAVYLLGHIVKDVAYATRETDGGSCAAWCSATRRMTTRSWRAFHGVTEGDAVINGVSGGRGLPCA